jgi:hypothetical protein
MLFGTKMSDDSSRFVQKCPTIRVVWHQNVRRFGWQNVRVLFVVNNIPALLAIFIILSSGPRMLRDLKSINMRQFCPFWTGEKFRRDDSIVGAGVGGAGLGICSILRAARRTRAALLPKDYTRG